MDGATTLQLFRLVYVPLMMPLGWSRSGPTAITPGLERIPLRVPAALKGYRTSPFP